MKEKLFTICILSFATPRGRSRNDLAAEREATLSRCEMSVKQRQKVDRESSPHASRVRLPIGNCQLPISH